MNITLSFSVQENKYQVTVPNNGQLIEIETLKYSLSNGYYRRLINVETVATNHTLDTIDMIAYLTILCPQLIKDLKCDTLVNLNVIDSVELLSVYRKEIAPWILEWQTFISRPLK